MLPGGAHLCRAALPIALVMSESSRGFPMNEAREWRVHKCINCADNRVYKLFSMSNTSLINKQVICLVAGVKIDPICHDRSEIEADTRNPSSLGQQHQQQQRCGAKTARTNKQNCICICKFAQIEFRLAAALMHFGNRCNNFVYNLRD